MQESHDERALTPEEVTADRPTYYAHSANRWGRWHLLADHLGEVARIAAEFAEAFEASEEARLAGLLHDLGKYGDRFQRRLRGLERGLDHWSAGAWLALTESRSLAAAPAIHGHHVGLAQLDKDSLRGWDPGRLTAAHPLGLTLSESDIGMLRDRLIRDGLSVPSLSSSLYGHEPQQTAAAMLDVRMLFSTLVDADYLDTEKHFKTDPARSELYRPVGPALQAETAFAILERHVAGLARRKQSSPVVRRLRADLWKLCREAGAGPQGAWTLSAPTGAGKTLAMLGFALKQAAQHELRRVVVVLPYLSIIEQTARIYRDLFRRHFGDEYVLEHHSLTGTRKEVDADGSDRDAESEARRRQQMLTENWDAPLILTTSVQLLESLFSNRPSACRKLHRLAKSVILFDEVQTLPLRLAIPTLATLSRLAARHHATVVFATATQPAFSHLDPFLHEQGEPGWRPAEIVAPHHRLFARVRRVHVDWPQLGRVTPWRELASQIAAEPQCLCIVNLKRHALELFNELRQRCPEGLYHLSTSMCPAHRQARLSEVRALLDPKTGGHCRLISTQCVEAGVDLDFPLLNRDIGPLDENAHAAGRCNRNGTRDLGRMEVFLPEEERYPSKTYEQAASVTRILLAERGPERMDIDDPELFALYYRSLYDISKPEKMKPDLGEAIRCQDFADVAARYRVVEEDSMNLLVPYQAAIYDQLADEVRRGGLTTDWIRRARSHAVSLFRPKHNDSIWSFVEKVPIAGDRMSDDWFIYLEPEHYQDDVGLLPPQAPPLWIV